MSGDGDDGNMIEIEIFDLFVENSVENVFVDGGDGRRVE